MSVMISTVFHMLFVVIVSGLVNRANSVRCSCYGERLETAWEYQLAESILKNFRSKDGVFR